MCGWRRSLNSYPTSARRQFWRVGLPSVPLLRSLPRWGSGRCRVGPGALWPRSGIPCPKIVGHGSIVNHSFMWAEIPCPKILGHGHPVKASVLAVRSSQSQHFGTRKNCQTFIHAVRNSVSQDVGTRKHRKTVVSAVRKSLSEYIGSRNPRKNMRRSGSVAV